MFTLDFYPTPVSVVKKMTDSFIFRLKSEELSEEDLAEQEAKVIAMWGERELSDEDYYRYMRDHLPLYSIPTPILEPSAGKGNICDFLVKRCGVSKRGIYAIEKDPELQMILQKKGYQVVDYDFLDYRCDIHFKTILMNPPFSQAEDHFLQAWKVHRGGAIVGIFNSEMVRNPYSEKRKLIVDIIKKHQGIVTHLGSEFKSSEHKTEVEVCIIQVEKPKKTDDYTFFGNGFEADKAFDFGSEKLSDPLAKQDVIANTVLLYEKVMEKVKELNQVWEELKFYSSHISEGYNSVATMVQQSLDKNSAEDRMIELHQKIKENTWRTVLGKTKLQDVSTSSVWENFDAFMAQQSNLAFNKRNIEDLFEMLFLNQGKFMNDALVNVFDMMTRYHKDNREHVEGWKTNDAFRVRQKVILPNFIRMGFNGFEIDYANREKLNDIDKVMGYIDGKKFSQIHSLQQALEDLFRNLNASLGAQNNNLVFSEYFKIRFFKKGTLHLYFLNERVWREFNLLAAKDKNWLPEGEWEAYTSAKSSPDKKMKLLNLAY